MSKEFFNGCRIVFDNYHTRGSFKLRYRQDPIPGTGNKKRYGRYFRRPRTTQEKRAYFDHIRQGARVRGRRHPCNLPDVYDDRYISNLSTGSWKRTKKRKQWM